MLDATEILLQGWTDAPAVRELIGVLRTKGLAHRFEPWSMRDVQRVVEHERTFRGPLLRADGRIVVGARAIRDFLEDHHPQPALRPRDISAAAWCHVLEDWAEEALAWRIAALRWLVPANREAAAGAVLSAVPAVLRSLGVRAAAAAMGLRLRARGQSAAGVPATEAALRCDLDELDRLLHDRESLLGPPHGRSMADLVVAAELQALDGTAYEESVRGRRSLSRWLRETRVAWD